jgi:hypothetical protein
MSSNRNINKSERIKNDILKGKQHLAHYSDKLMPARVHKSLLVFENIIKNMILYYT